MNRYSVEPVPTSEILHSHTFETTCGSPLSPHSASRSDGRVKPIAIGCVSYVDTALRQLMAQKFLDDCE